MEQIWFLLTLMLDIIPFIILSLILLRDKLDCSILVAAIKLLIPMFIFNGLIYVTYMNHMYSANIMVCLRLSGDILAFLLLCLTFKQYYLQFAYKCLFTLPFMLGVLQMSAFCINYLHVEHWPDYMAMTILRFFFYVLFAYPYYKLEKNLIVEHFDNENPMVWSYFVISQFILDMAMMASLRTDYAENGIDTKSFLIQMIMMFASISVTIILFYAFKVTSDMAIVKDKQMRDELLLELNSKQYGALQNNIAKTRQARHDMRHHLRTICQMMAEERYQEVREYLNEYEENLPNSAKIDFCENLTLNALLEYYYTIAVEHHIDIEFEATDLVECRINDVDLNILLGNALENAIEASDNVNQGERRIRLCAKKKSGGLFLTIDNTFDGITKNKKGELLSKKREYMKSGYGNASMDAVVEKYAGYIKREVSENQYKVSIMLNDV